MDFQIFKKSFFKPSRTVNLLRMDLDSFLWLLERVSFLKILFIFFYFSFGFFKPKKIAQENEISNIFFIQLQVDSMIFKTFVKPRSFKKMYGFNLSRINKRYANADKNVPILCKSALKVFEKYCPYQEHMYKKWKSWKCVAFKKYI